MIFFAVAVLSKSLFSLNGSEHSSGHDKSRQSDEEENHDSGQPPRNNGLKTVKSVSDFFPDEIQVVLRSTLAVRDEDVNNESSSSSRRRTDNASSQRSANTHHTNECDSSFSTIDSENFAGDFTAWRQSFKRLTDSNT